MFVVGHSKSKQRTRSWSLNPRGTENEKADVGQEFTGAFRPAFLLYISQRHYGNKSEFVNKINHPNEEKSKLA